MIINHILTGLQWLTWMLMWESIQVMKSVHITQQLWTFLRNIRFCRSTSYSLIHIEVVVYPVFTSFLPERITYNIHTFINVELIMWLPLLSDKWVCGRQQSAVVSAQRTSYVYVYSNTHSYTHAYVLMKFDRFVQCDTCRKHANARHTATLKTHQHMKASASSPILRKACVNLQIFGWYI